MPGDGGILAVGVVVLAGPLALRVVALPVIHGGRIFAMALIAIKELLLSFVLMLGCAAGPDEVVLSYGHEFAGGGRIDAHDVSNDDSDFVGIGFVWKLRPTRVEVVSPVVPVIPVVLPQEPDPVEPEDAPT